MKRWDNHPQPQAGLCYRAKVSPAIIGHLVSLVEAYDGLAVVRTKDKAAGIVEFWISPLMQKDFEGFLEFARQELGVVFGKPTVLDVGAPGFPDA